MPRTSSEARPLVWLPVEKPRKPTAKKKHQRTTPPATEATVSAAPALPETPSANHKTAADRAYPRPRFHDAARAACQ